MPGFTTPTVEAFRARHGGFTASDASVSITLDDAAAETSQKYMPEQVWGRAVSLLTAHRLALAGQGTEDSSTYHEMRVAGVSMIRDGDTEVRLNQLADDAATTSPNGATPYGREYDALVQRYAPRGLGICG
ncbi:MAG: DUF4054 domain-containing protein [Pseudomonadota bacterium]